MKIFFAVLALVVSQNALAYPVAGDMAEFKNVDGSILTLKNNGYDAANHVWNVEVSQNGQVSVEKFTDADMATEKNVAAVLSQCVQSSGTPETVVVPAGTFPACKFSNQSGGSTWIADVPFGMVKVVTAELSLELTSFTAVK